MSVAPGADNFDDEGARYKRQRMSSPSPAPTVVTDPQDTATASTKAELPLRPPTVDEYPVHSQQQCRIFQLPFELREMIYDMVCVNDGISAVMGRNTSRHASQDSAKEPAFLRSCRLARLEGQPVFYQKNDFVVRRRDSINFHPRPLVDEPIAYPYSSFSTGVPRWLDNMSSEKIGKIQTVVLVQMARGVYKDAYNEWHRDGSAMFRIKYSKKRQSGYEIQYVCVDTSGRSDRYAERLREALEMRMDKLVKDLGIKQWNRQSIWDMAYLL
ncbi:hypothetical protein E4T47_05542 [Aureobasidium subglaciale]|nr:hypothetical protein E4T47_05542 [Aureobasidium subglaciale]